MLVREGILDVLASRSSFHADDLEPLGIPDEHRNVIGSQIAKLVNQRWLQETGRRKSTIPSRNGAKSGIYELTPLGRMKLLAGVGSDNPEGTAPPSDRGTLDRPAVIGTPGGNGAGSSLAADPGEGRLFETEPKRPRSAFRDAEAA